MTRHNSYILLDGEWRFALDPLDQGLQEEWYLQHAYTGLANWPGSIEAQMAKLQTNGQVPGWQDEVVAWYERDGWVTGHVPGQHGGYLVPRTTILEYPWVTLVDSAA